MHTIDKLNQKIARRASRRFAKHQRLSGRIDSDITGPYWKMSRRRSENNGEAR